MPTDELLHLFGVLVLLEGWKHALPPSEGSCPLPDSSSTFQEHVPCLCFSTHQDPAGSKQPRKQDHGKGKKRKRKSQLEIGPLVPGMYYGCQKCEAAAHTAMSETPWALGSSLHRDPQDSRSCLRLRRSLTNNHTLIFHKPKFAFWPRDC